MYIIIRNLTFVTVGLDDLVEGFGLLGNVFASLDSQLLHESVVFQGDLQFSLTFAFQTLDNITVMPADFVGQTAQLTVFAVRAQSQDAHSDGYANTTAFIVGRWNTIEDTETSQSGLTALGFVWDHA